MNLTVDQIKAEIEAKHIGAISIDTSIFDQLGRSLEWGLLKRLRQFSSTDVSLVLSDVVERELRAHLVKDAKDAQTALRKALKDVGNAWNAPVEKRDGAVGLLLGTDTPASIAAARLSSFSEKTDLEIASAEEFASMNELMNRYFEIRPPFADKETKKNEFPDALALLTLEAWATEHDTHVLVVTRDGDWKNYLTESPRLVGIEDLGVALECFQVESARYLTSQLSERLNHPELAALVADIEDRVREQSWKVDFSVEAESQFGVTEEETQVEFENVEIVGLDDESSLELVEYDGATLVARLELEVTAQITSTFSFSKWDSIDRDEIPMGSTTISRTEELTLHALLTVSGNLPEHPEFEEVEVLQQREHLSVGEIEPDWMNDPDNFGE